MGPGSRSQGLAWPGRRRGRWFARRPQVCREFAPMAKPLAVDARRQRRRGDRGFPAQDRAAALRPLHPPSGRLPFRLHQAGADRRCGVAVHGQCPGLAGVRAWRRGLARHARPVRPAISAHVRVRGKAPASVRVHGGLAVLPEEFHAHARAFRHLWLPARDLSLALPARSIVYVLLAALFSIVLVLIHHIHLLMYVPTIAVIVIVRYYLAVGVNRANATVGVLAALCLGALFVAAQFFGTMPVPEAEFVRHLQSRMADPSRTDLLSFSYIWYQPLSKEISDTWARMPSNLLGVPVFALLIWLHTPLWRYFAETIRALVKGSHRRIVIASLIGVSLGYLVMFAIVFDYSRWISNWAVCLFLILHAVKTLPASQSVPPIEACDRKTTLFGWIVTLIPRVGIVRPF